MEVVDQLASCPAHAQRSIVTIGNFDGLHMGHRAVIADLCADAAAAGHASAVVTFEPHTMATVRPDTAPRRLTTRERKIELLDQLGVDYAVVVDFDSERASQPPSEFVQEVLVDCLHASEVTVGDDFRFGYRARGDIDLLRQLGVENDFVVSPVRIVSGPDGPYSSTQVRIHLAKGEMEAVTAALVRPYDVRGTVIRGDRRARDLGYPTANIDPAEHFLPMSEIALPPFGVYAARVRVLTDDECSAGWSDAVVSFGFRPTLRREGDDPRPLIEAHIFDETVDLYGRRIDVAFVRRLRDEAVFDGFAELRARIDKDAIEARRVLAEAPSHERAYFTRSFWPKLW